ncbi:MAG: LysR family transcriptional regulator [Lautropia sp.]
MPIAPSWHRRLRLRQLELLLELARQPSLTAAADALHLTQPAVSQQLADIESALGVALFERSRGLRPTASGLAMLRYAEQVVAGAQRVGDEVRALQAGTAGLVRIGVMLVAATVLVPRALGRLQDAGHAIRIELVEDIMQGLWPRLERGELDVVAGRIDATVRAGTLPFEVLYDDPHVVVCGPDHPLARRRRPGWTDAAGHPWVLPPLGSALRNAIDASFGALGMRPPLSRIDSGSLAATQSLLLQTDCLAVISRSAARHAANYGLLRMLPLELVADVGPVGIAWSSDRPGPAVEQVLAALRREARMLATAG